MGQVKFEPCEVCRKAGRDRAGDNKAVYVDGSTHCFSCGDHSFPRGYVRKKVNANENKAVLPNDFTREVPAGGWKWLLQYGLSYSYWAPYIGYSEETNRLIFTVGKPTRFSIGRYIGDGGDRKWRIWGNRAGYVDVLGNEKEGPVVLVEDIISAHKVAQISTCIPLFGTKVSDEVISTLLLFKRPIRLWLDSDQYTLLPPKLNRLAAFLGPSVRHVYTTKDPKNYSLTEIKEIIDGT